MNKVLKEYDRFRAAYEAFQAEAMVREGELRKIEAEARTENEKLQKLAQGDLAQKKISDKITMLIAQFEAGKKQAQAEFAQKDAEMMATIYNEMQQMSARVAAWRGYAMVIKYSSTPATGSDPDSIRATISNAMVYADPKLDITADVTKFLNQEYYQRGGQKPKGTGTTPGAAQPPASAANPTPTQPR